MKTSHYAATVLCVMLSLGVAPAISAQDPRLTPPPSLDSPALKPTPVAANSLEARIAASLPRYQPEQTVSGTISIWGHGNIKLPWMHHLIETWQQGFQKFHPEIRFNYQMHGTSSGIPPLFTGVGDIAILGEEILPKAAAAFEKFKGYPPIGIEIAGGSMDVRNFDYAQQIFVHKDNPIDQITLAELDAVFGHEHRRGTHNIRDWGQLGLDGEWATQPIQPYAWAIDDSFGFFFEQFVLEGSHRWNNALREHVHITYEDDSIYDHGQQILDALAKDRYGIAISNIRYAGPNVKPLAIARDASGPYVQASKQTLIDQSYPLARTIPAVIDRAPGKPVEPKVREFLRFLLSREGQELINADGRYLPLSPRLIAEQLRKLQ
jgi:phosphate transport system substrate-binding protein